MSERRASISDQSHHVRPVLRGAVIGTMAAVALTVSSASVGLAVDEPSPDPAAVPDVLILTPSQAEGPFYPVEVPADRDADLTVVDGADVPAAGEALIVEGRLLTAEGVPIEGAVVEIWQTDHQGVYLHPLDPGIAARDEAFQGYGESVTDAAGVWSFRTILPEIYGGRPRHIHAKVKIAGETALTTQIYFSGGDISQEGAVALDAASAPLVVEVLRRPEVDGAGVLYAQHLLVIPPLSDG